MKEYHLCHPSQPEQFHGPYTLPELQEWKEKLPEAVEFYVWDGEWKPFLSFLESQPSVLLEPDFNVSNQEKNLQAESWHRVEELPTKKAIQKNIRDLLDRLWEAHRELFFTRDVYAELPHDRYDETWAEAEQIKEDVILRIEEYCAATGMIDRWIRDLIIPPGQKTTGVYKIVLPQELDYREKYFSVQAWLEKIGKEKSPGCYCFIKETPEDTQPYLYIGQSGKLGERLETYYSSKSLFWHEATHLKIYLLNTSKFIKKEHENKLNHLERLLIVRHWQSHYNQASAQPGHTAEDEKRCELDLLVHRIKTRMNIFFQVPKAALKTRTKRRTTAKPVPDSPSQNPSVVLFSANNEQALEA